MSPIRRSLYLNWALVALAFCSLAAVSLTRDLATSADREARERNLLPSFDGDRVERIELRGKETLVIVRSRPATTQPDGARHRAASGAEVRFRIIEPIEAAAEEATVDQLLRSVRFAGWLRQVEVGASKRKSMGLSEPLSSVAFVSDAKRFEVSVGGDARSPTGARYVEVKSPERRGIFVVSANTARDLSPDPAEFRVRRLIPYSESELSRVTLESEVERLSFEHAGDGSWRFAKRYGGARLDRSSSERLFLQFARTQAEDFLPVAEARRLQSAARSLVRLGFTPRRTGAAQAEVTLGGKCPTREGATLGVRTAPEPIAACLTSDMSAQLLARAELLVDRNLFRLRPDEVEQVRIERGEERLEFARKGDGFVMRAPKRGDVERSAGATRVDAISGAAGEPLSEAEARDVRFEPVATVTLRSGAAREEDVTEEKLELGAVGNGFAIARRLEDGALLRVSARTAEAFRVDSLMLRKRNLLDVPAEAIRQVRLETEGGRQVLLQPRRGVFELEEPPDFEVDAGLAVDVVDALAQLEALHWVSETPEERHGLAPPKLHCFIQVEHGAEAESRMTEHELRIGSGSSDGGIFASFDGTGVLVLPRSVLTTLSTWLVDRSAFMLDTETLERLRLDAGERILELERLGQTFIQRGGDSSVSPGRITELLDAFSMLRAEALVATKTPGADHGAGSPVLRVTAKIRHDALGAPTTRSFTIGSADTFNDVAIHYAWLGDREALYALPRQSVRRILELW